MSLTRVCPARTPLPPPVYVAGAVRDQTTAPHAPPAPLPRASPRTDVALLRQRQPAAAAAPPAAITTSRRCGHRAAPAAPPGLLPGLSRLPGHRPGLGEGGAAGRSSQHPPEGAGLCAAVSPRLCRSPRSLPLALALLPFCPDPLQPIRGQAPPCQERGDHRPQPAGPAARPRQGRRRLMACSGPSDSAASAPVPSPRRSRRWRGSVSPSPASRLAVSFPSKKIHPPSQTTPRGQDLAPGCRPGHPPCGRGAQSPDGPRPPARPGAAAFAAASLGVLGADHTAAISDFPPQRRIWCFCHQLHLHLASGGAGPRPLLGCLWTAPAAVLGPPGPVAGVELGFVVATKAVNADIFSIVIGVCDLKFRVLEWCFPAWGLDK